MIAINNVDMPRCCDDCMFYKYTELDYYRCDLTTYSVNPGANERDSKCPLIDLTSLELITKNDKEEKMGRTVRNVLTEIEEYKKVVEKLSAYPENAKCREDVVKAIKECLEYRDFILLKGLVEQRISDLLESEVVEGEDDD